MSDYEFVTSEMFEKHLLKILKGMSAEEIYSITGVAEIVREELNNEVLSSCEDERP